MRKRLFLVGTVILAVWLCMPAARSDAQTFERMKAQVREHTLSNGMKWIVLPRRDAPVVSFHVYVDAGSVNEVNGITGISHLLEHLAFKGTKTVGTKDFTAERVVLGSLDSLYDAITREELKFKPDTARIAAQYREFETLRMKAQEYVAGNEFIDLFQNEGEPGIDAYTSWDATQYINALPSNRLEFWMAMTSDRFLNPVFREFFKERDVVIEERRLRIETQPIGRLVMEDFPAAAFKAHTYRHSVVGHMSDLKRITRGDVKAYFSKYYIPSNMAAAVVGDVDPEDVFRQAELYFGRIPSGPKPEAPRTIEPEQWGERRVQVAAQSQPILILGYHRPDIRDKDNQAFDALANIIGQGRSSRLHRVLVKEKKAAIQTGSFSGFPGSKYPSLIAFYAIPSQGHSNAECLEVILAEIERLKTEPVGEDELTKYKRSVKKDLFDAMKANGNMAAMLTASEMLEGDWRKVFDGIQDVESVTAADIQRIAKSVLTADNRTIGEVVPEEPAAE
ncbi:insulinase family protein [bacterium]|nr:insulinase family protein [bacterium]